MRAMSETPTAPPPDADICFIDTETTGLARPWLPHGRRMWEFAGIRLEAAIGATFRLHLVIADVSIADATPEALDIGGYFERHPNGGGQVPIGARYVTEDQAARLIAEFTRGAWLSGSNVPFDEENLAALLVRRKVIDPYAAGPTPFPWHHHTYDVLAYAAGYLGLRPPWSSRSIAEVVGIPRDAAGKAHAAMPDAEWCLFVHKRIHHPEMSLEEHFEAVREVLAE
jgi:hypothetical protein